MDEGHHLDGKQGGKYHHNKTAEGNDGVVYEGRGNKEHGKSHGKDTEGADHNQISGFSEGKLSGKDAGADSAAKAAGG